MAARPRSAAFSSQSTQSKFPSKLNPAPEKQQKMSLTQTYFLAHTARGKLSKEASRPDHDLRLLVGHANLLDSLMSDLADAEQEQEQWFNQTVKGATKASDEPKHIQWADTIVEEPENDWAIEDADTDSQSDSDSESEYDEDEDIEMGTAIPLQKYQSHAGLVNVSTTEVAVDDEEFDEDDEEDYGDLALVRTSSHQPPELLDDSGESSDDDSMPPSPPQPMLDVVHSKPTKSRPATSVSLSTTEQNSFFEEGYYLPQRNGPQMISAY
ncbi:MAG: hypothetical protein M1833_003003 [Piccolia ochrophora]|nr:MAG: hypothetical protein M1833_003003 [Piccolia ochrophora]